MKEETVIKVEGLTKVFGDFTAVNKISFHVRKGEIFGFLGANGAGKTTAMKMLIGISAPSSGSANVAGFDVYMDRAVNVYHLRRMKVSSANQVHEIDSFWC
jgi:ABC-2 type transport system ATP-binding protein